MCKLVVAGENTPPVLAINSLDKAFHFPKFQAKYFFFTEWAVFTETDNLWSDDFSTNVDY